jgi:hypothetical protein
MPKKLIDYSKCLIYKLCCKDPKISDIYIGHTTNKTERKRSHRSACNNENYIHYNLYVYQFIRDNGGFDNWEMIVIEKYPCENVDDARLRERYWFETLGATLNKNVPSRTIQEYKKKYHENNKDELNEKSRIYRENNKEILNEKHREYNERNREYINERQREYNEKNREIINEKKNEKFECECGGKYTRSNKGNHIKTKKHIEYLESKTEE